MAPKDALSPKDRKRYSRKEISAFSKNIQKRRLELDMSQAALAKLLDMPPSRISELEAGRFPSDPEKIIRIAEALEVDINWLFGYGAEFTYYGISSNLFREPAFRTGALHVLECLDGHPAVPNGISVCLPPGISWLAVVRAPYGNDISYNDTIDGWSPSSEEAKLVYSLCGQYHEISNPKNRLAFILYRFAQFRGFPDVVITCTELSETDIFMTSYNGGFQHLTVKNLFLAWPEEFPTDFPK